MVGMMLTGENQSTRAKTCTSAECATKIPHGLAWDLTRNFFCQSWAVNCPNYYSQVCAE